MYDIKEIYKPSNLHETLDIMAGNPEGIIISGGTDVLIRLKERKLKECQLISIHNLKELQGISHNESLNDITIYPGTCFEEIHGNNVIEKYCHCLWQASDEVGSPQIRTVATIGGNVCNGAVSADSAPSLLVLNAELELTNIKHSGLNKEPGAVKFHSRRNVPIGQFFTGPGKTVIEKGKELLTAIKIPAAPGKSGSYYIKFGTRNALEISTLGCAVFVTLNESKSVFEDFRIAFGVAAPTPVRCMQLEGQVKGLPLTRETLKFIGNEVLKEVNPRDSWRASKQLRLQLIRELSQRATEGAVKNAGGAIID
ncbi:MAG: xanthine dehydrogenase FAD-binding subunit XdhB [Hungatella sp.]|jgi:xanthine dehydrogenase FAD-binding subunit|nr:xanthine dehydrogenase FAD-binding subunit XdhB [Hungatella sp.]